MDLVKYYFVILFIISFTSLNLCQQCLKSCKDSSKFEKVIRIAILLPSEKSENQEQNSCDVWGVSWNAMERCLKTAQHSFLFYLEWRTWREKPSGGG